MFCRDRPRFSLCRAQPSFLQSKVGEASRILWHRPTCPGDYLEEQVCTYFLCRRWGSEDGDSLANKGAKAKAPPKQSGCKALDRRNRACWSRKSGEVESFGAATLPAICKVHLAESSRKRDDAWGLIRVLSYSGRKRGGRLICMTAEPSL